MPPGDIRIRSYEEGDAAALFEAARESIDTVGPWLPWCHPKYALEDAQRWVREQLEAPPDRHEFAIVGGDRFHGGIGLNAIDDERQWANLGYWVRAADRGRGIAPTAIALVVQWAGAHTDLRTLDAVVATANTASLRALAKTAAVRRAEPGRLRAGGVTHEAVVFSFTP